jgi:hypothetical protein
MQLLDYDIYNDGSLRITQQAFTGFHFCIEIKGQLCRLDSDVHPQIYDKTEIFVRGVDTDSDSHLMTPTITELIYFNSIVSFVNTVVEYESTEEGARAMLHRFRRGRTAISVPVASYGDIEF